MTEQIPTLQAILRRARIIAITGLSGSTIDRRVADGSFPAPFKLGGGRAIGWSAAAVNQWISEQIRQKSPSVEDSLASLGAEVARHSPDMLVQFDGMAKPMRLADAVAALRTEVARDLEQGALIKAAADCHLGGAS